MDKVIPFGSKWESCTAFPEKSRAELPDDSLPVSIAVTDALYVKTEKGIYRRTLCEACTDFETPKRKHIGYYD